VSDSTFSLTLKQRDDYQFDVTFDDDTWPELLLDEPEPLGQGAGPNASRLIGAGVGNCLAASLLFCLRKAHVDVTDLRVKVQGTLGRNERGRLRITHIGVTLIPSLEEEPSGRYDRCLGMFEDFCVVTASIRKGIDVDVTVEPAVGSGGG